MEFMQVLTNRRSVRSYEERRMEPAAVCALIEAAIQAPSAMDQQPWEFWVLLGRARIQEVSERAKNWLLERLARDPSASAQARRQHLAPVDVALFYHAPALVLVAAKSLEEQAVEDCCLAAGDLMLAAREAGIGSCWIGAACPWFNLPDIKKEFGIPPHDRVVAPIVLGYPSEWPQAPERRPAKIHWLTCGQEPDLC